MTDLIVRKVGEPYNVPQKVMDGVVYAYSDVFGCYAIDEAGELWEVPYQRNDVLTAERIEETMHKVLDDLWIPDAP